jgi:ribosomal protein L37AE/L43A
MGCVLTQSEIQRVQCPQQHNLKYKKSGTAILYCQICTKQIRTSEYLVCE